MRRSYAILLCVSLAACPGKPEQGPQPPPPKPTPSAADGEVRIVKMHRPGEDPLPPPRPEPGAEPPRRPAREDPEPARPEPEPARPEPAPGAGALVKVRCAFDQGFVAVLPAHLYDPGEPYLMQALIGISEDPAFWRGLDEYKKLQPYKAIPCDRNGQTFSLAPGKFVVAVGRAGQFSVHGKYKDNGFLRRIDVKQGNRETIDVRTRDLRHTWNCISCPYLVVFRAGKAVEVGQVLVDRYTRRRRGTDVVSATAEVVDGVLVIRLEEREPETSFVAGVVVTANGAELRPLRRAAIPALELEMGDAVDLKFDASRFADGPLDVQIAVSGHYEPIGPLL